MAFSLFRGIRRVSLIKIAQCLDPDPNLKYQKVKKRDKSPKKGSPVDNTGYHHSKREKDYKKSERKRSKKDQKDQISRKSEKTGQAEIPRNQDGSFNVEKEHSGVIERLLETGDRPESPVPDYEPDYDEPGEFGERNFLATNLTSIQFMVQFCPGSFIFRTAQVTSSYRTVRF